MSLPAPARRARHRAVRRWLVVVAASLAVGLAAPTAWWLTRPPPDAGASLAEVRAASTGAPAPVPARGTTEPSAGSSAAGPARDAPDERADDRPGAVPAFGEVTVRDAGLDALASDRVPDPVRVQVPDLGIDAAVEPVGAEDDGSMVIPAEVASVGWYRYGPAPGARSGNAVLAGHVDTIAQGPGALFPLREVAVGALLTVTDAEGVERQYEVAGRETMIKDMLPVEEIFARDGAHVLVVITCGGPYLPDTRRYRDNVVVIAVPVGGGA